MARIEKRNLAELQTALNFRCRLDIHTGVIETIKDDPIRMMSVLTSSDIAVRISDSITDKEKGLDIDFEIEKTSGSEPQKSKITIWNLSPTTYKKLENGTKIEFYGAYGKDNYSRISIGTLDGKSQEENKVVSTTNKGFLWKDKQAGGQVDVPTTIEFLDSGLLYQFATISKSYKGIVDFSVIVRDILSIYEVPVNNFDIQMSYAIKDYVARGKFQDIMNELFNRIGGYWDITNGSFSCYLEKREPKTYGIVLNSSNSNRPVAEENGYKIETKLLPFLNPDTYCKLNFTNVSGVYKITRVKHTGNNYGTQGKTEIWCDVPQTQGATNG